MQSPSPICHQNTSSDPSGGYTPGCPLPRRVGGNGANAEDIPCDGPAPAHTCLEFCRRRHAVALMLLCIYVGRTLPQTVAHLCHRGVRCKGGFEIRFYEASTTPVAFTRSLQGGFETRFYVASTTLLAFTRSIQPCADTVIPRCTH